MVMRLVVWQFWEDPKLTTDLALLRVFLIFEAFDFLIFV